MSWRLTPTLEASPCGPLCYPRLIVPDIGWSVCGFAECQSAWPVRYQCYRLPDCIDWTYPHAAVPVRGYLRRVRYMLEKILSPT